MSPNPFLCVLFHWLGGGFFSWIVCPWFFAGLMTRDLLGVLSQQSPGTLWWTYFFGAMWGMGVALGYCVAFGTLLPRFLKIFVDSIPVPETIAQIAATRPGQITHAGVGVCLLGIGTYHLKGLGSH